MITVILRDRDTYTFPGFASLKIWCKDKGYEWFNDGRIYETRSRNFIGRFSICSQPS